MTMFKVKRGLEADLPSEILNGTMYFCTDTGNIFIDMGNQRKQISGERALKDSEGNNIIDTYAKKSETLDTTQGNIYVDGSKSLIFRGMGDTKHSIGQGIAGYLSNNKDAWRVVGNQESADEGYLEIATAQDGNEPIYVRQYQGSFSANAAPLRTAILLDGNGNTSFPGTVTASKFDGVKWNDLVDKPFSIAEAQEILYYVLNIDYDDALKFDTTEIVINGNVSHALGHGALGEIVLS